jgi:hypothetical protein
MVYDVVASVFERVLQLPRFPHLSNSEVVSICAAESETIFSSGQLALLATVIFYARHLQYCLVALLVVDLVGSLYAIIGAVIMRYETTNHATLHLAPHHAVTA